MKSKRELILVLAGFLILSVLPVFFINRQIINQHFLHRYFFDVNQTILLEFDYLKLEKDVYAGYLLFLILIVFLCVFFYHSGIKYGTSSTNNNLLNLLQKIENKEIISANDLFSEEVKKTANSIEGRLEQQERKLDREILRKDELLAFLAHDLRTPLTAIIGYLRLIQDSKQTQYEYTERALHQAYRLEQLMNDFFDITKLNLRKNNPHLENTNLGFMLVQICDELYPLYQEKKLNFVFQMADEIEVKVDISQMARAFSNVIRNAIIYAYPESDILISDELISDMVSIQITDYGKPIEKGDLSHLFDQFFRADPSRSQDGGSGLGLAISKDIIEKHGGYIQAFSENNRTTFKIVLPYAKNMKNY